MDHFVEIYTNQAAKYHHMITREDVDSKLLPALEQVASFQDKRVLDLGTGTGRLPLLVADQTAQFVGLDLHGAMLLEHQHQKVERNGQWTVIQGDMRFLPFPTGWADIVTTGWAIGHLAGWHVAEWEQQISTVLKEMHRLLTKNGAIIIIETLTTGSLSPAPPSKHLARYYSWLENEWGFTRQEVQTDYQFDSADEAVRQTEFFFGAELAATIRQKRWARLPEWTGVWGKRV